MMEASKLHTSLRATFVAKVAKPFGFFVTATEALDPIRCQGLRGIRVACVAILTLVLFPSAAVRADDNWSDDWNKTLAAARVDDSRPILVKYEASWCGPCRMLTEEMQQENVRELLVGFHLLRIDVDQPPEDADVDGVNSLPTMRVITPAGEIIQQQVGLLQGETLIDWLRQGEASHQEIARRHKFAKRLSSGVLDAEQIDLLLEMLQDRSASQRSAATELLVRHPQLVATKIIDLLSAATIRSRVAALDVLRRWPAPIDGIDPWQPDTVTAERISALKTWAASIASDDPAAEADKQLFAKPSAEVMAEADLEIDRLLRRGPVREGLIDGLAVIGPELLSNVTTRLATEASDTARERLTAVRYRLVASPTLSIRIPGATDKLASLDSSPRRIAAQMLSEQAQKDDVPLLEALFAHDDPLVRELALRGMQHSGGGETSDLVRFLKDPDKNVRAAVLKLWLDDPRGYLAKPVSEHAVVESDPGLLVYYVRLLKEIDGSKDEVYDAIAKLAEHHDWQVRAEVAEAIAHFTKQQSDSGTGIRSIHVGLREPARLLLKDKDAFVLSKIVPAIIQADQSDSFKQLLQVAWKHPPIRDTILPKLSSEFHDDEDVEFLIARFESGEADSRGFALEAMSRLHVPTHETYIRRGLDDQDSGVLLAALRSLNFWLDTYHRKLPVLPKDPAASGGGGDIFGQDFQVDFDDEVMAFDSAPVSRGFLSQFSELFSGKTPSAESDAETESAAEDEPAAADTEHSPKPANDDRADDENDAMESVDTVEIAVGSATEPQQDTAPEADTYDAWLSKWRSSPSAVLPWLDGVKPIVERLRNSEDAVIKAHATLSAVRLGIEIEPQEISQSVSELPDSAERLKGVYPWLSKEQRSGLIYVAAESKHVDSYLTTVLDAARVYDKDTVAADAWKSLEHVDPRHVETGYYIRSAMMQVTTGRTYFSSSSEQGSAKIADELQKTISTLESPFARLVGISLMGDIDGKRVDALVADAYDDSDLDDATRRDWGRMALGAKGTDEATTLAIQWLHDDTFRNIALDFIAEGHTGIAQTEVASIEVPNAGRSSYSGGMLSVANVAAAVQPSMITPLLDHDDPDVVAKATYVLIVMGEDVDITPLENAFRSKGIDEYLRGWTNLYILAVATRNHDADIQHLEEIYEKVSDDDYRAKEFYWKIRIMTGPRALLLRKRIRDEVGMDNLI